jgi:hypothetical protein
MGPNIELTNSFVAPQNDRTYGSGFGTDHNLPAFWFKVKTNMMDSKELTQNRLKPGQQNVIREICTTICVCKRYIALN